MKTSGFSLIEFLIIIVVLVIIAGISAVSLRSIQPVLELNGITRELITDLRYAQQLALAQQIDHGVYLFSTENKYQIIKYGATQEILKEKALPLDIEFFQIDGFTNNEVKFNAYGAAQEGGTIIILAVKNNTTTTIEVRPSGFVKNK